MVGAQQPRPRSTRPGSWTNQGDGAARQMAGRYGEQADRQDDYREGRPGESGGVGTVLEGFAGMLTSGTGMADWGVLAKSNVIPRRETLCTKPIRTITVAAGSTNRRDEVTRRCGPPPHATRRPRARTGYSPVSAVSGMGMPGDDRYPRRPLRRRRNPSGFQLSACPRLAARVRRRRHGGAVLGNPPLHRHGRIQAGEHTLR